MAACGETIAAANHFFHGASFPALFWSGRSVDHLQAVVVQTPADVSVFVFRPFRRCRAGRSSLLSSMIESVHERER